MPSSLRVHEPLVMVQTVAHPSRLESELGRSSTKPAQCVCVTTLSSCTGACRFGQARSKAEEYLSWFETSYWLQRLEVAGDDVRVLRGYPLQWQVRPYARYCWAPLVSLRPLLILSEGCGFPQVPSEACAEACEAPTGSNLRAFDDLG